MRLNLLILSFLFASSSLLFAQPANDDCSGLIDLGVIPYCPADEFFTNVNATETDIGANNFPTGCSGGDITFAGRDVWFQFTTDATTLDYTITATGITDGMGSTALSNPQVTIYRGDCAFDELSLLGCGKAADGANEMAVDILGLDPNTSYFIRVNDWSASAAENWGTFKLCIQELEPIYTMGQSTGAVSCSGTLYDSGGENGDYGNNENLTFTICPNEAFACLNIDLQTLNTENNNDFLSFFAGDNTGAPLISQLSGGIVGSPFEIQVTSPCVTVQFESDFSVVQDGFVLDWTCSATPCDGSSIDNPTVINNIPFDEDGVTTCDEAATFGQSPCGNDDFLNGPDYVFTYDSPGGICVSINITNTNDGTGVLVLNGPPDDPATVCVSVSASGNITGANMETPGTYYIVVANAEGCTDFDIAISESECSFPVSLVDALCNPINACENNPDGTPAQFAFEDGFQDIPNTNGVNDGCWGGVGFEPDYVWFTVSIQEDGPFGFILSGGVPSDIDWNVWGPFSDEQVCDSPATVIDFITNNQPIRSSYAGNDIPTGLTDIHPDFGYPITDVYDCDGVGLENNDQFCRTVDALEGEHYVVLLNDWGNVAEGIINVDWSPSGDGVLDVDLIDDVVGADTALCIGQSVQLEFPDWLTSIQWLPPSNGTLSCTDCLDPIATPTSTSTYFAAVEGLCISDTIKVEVFVYDVSLGSDITICMGEDVPLSPDMTFDDVDYIWTGQNLSCTNCPATVVTTNTAGTFEYTIEQVSATCSLFDTIQVTVLPDPAPSFEVSDSLVVCIGTEIEMGNPNNAPGQNYVWSSNPAGFISTGPNPTATPQVSTTYYAAVIANGACPVISIDSVYVQVDNNAIVNLANDTTVCQGELVTLGTTVEQDNVVYSWSPATDLDDANIPNPVLTAETTGDYILTTTYGACEQMDTVTVNVSTINLEILNDPDFTTICLGESVTITSDVQPLGATINWTTDNGSFTGTGNPLVVSPNIITTYYAEVSIPGCMKLDTFTIDVDSLPTQLDIFPADTTVCPGAFVTLFTPPYLPSEFPEIEHTWVPLSGQQTPDSLFNMAIQAGDDPAWYYRETVNGVCISVDSVLVDVFEIPIIDISPANPTICQGDQIQLTASSPDIEEFTWSPATTLSCEVCPDPVASPTTDTDYMVEGEFEGCPVTANVFVDVNVPAEDGVIDGQICEGESIFLNADFEPTYTYSWTSDPAGFTSTDPNPSVSPMVTTTYFVSILDPSSVCPPTMNELTVNVSGNDVAIDVSEDISLCDNEEDLTVELSATSDDEGTYTWSPNIGTGPTLMVSFDDSLSNNIYEYEVTFTNNCGFSVTDMISVTLNQAVIVTSILVEPDSNNLVFNEGEEITLTAITSPENAPSSTIYNWTEGGMSIGDSTSQLALVALNPTNTIFVNAITAEGCNDPAQVTFTVIPAIFEIPNAFTPNRDGNNDRFRLLTKGAITIKSFQIFSRWGQKVYDDVSTQGWNGTYKDKPMPQDVYIYKVVIVRPNGVDEETLEGELTLIR